MLLVTALMVLEAAQPKLAAPGLTSPNLDAKTTRYFSEALAQRMSDVGFNVVTAAQLEQVLGLERQKQLVGCGGEDCMVELAQALGVDGIVVGSLAKFGEVYQLNVRVVSSVDGAPLAVATRRVTGAEALNDALLDVANELADVMSVRRPRAAWQVLIPVAAGVGLAAVGTGFLVSGENRRAALRGGDEAVVGSDPRAFAASTSQALTLGVVLVAAGAAAVGSAIVWWWLGGTPERAPVVSVSSQGAWFGVVAQWP